ncbi:4-amino-4-deoxy-L-arabinose transferase [Nocardioides marmorisolisilvae]|uniref:4-amino-4-deoxy-L-arabinose transferase n=1 Tax=Nocardioides marmorisolisilvae TaxID=1542737 RepID=UPI001FE37FC1|nr:4-amino-4-deoxy-L-arabinose transferase [Nocardioides marmorisolisilvae]
MTAPSLAAAQVAEHVNSRPATLGAGKLICIDGPSGSGKTTLADRLVRLVPATVVHTDQLCPGWDGLPAVPAILSTLLTPLAEGRTGRFREWDWIRDRLAETVEVDPAPVLLIEGLGAGARSIAGWTTTLVWVDAEVGQRRTRAFERDGDYFRDQWAGWAAAEDAYFSAEQVRERADLSFRTG